MKTFKEYISTIRESDQNDENTKDDEKINYPGGVYISVKMTEESQIALNEYTSKYLKDAELNEELHCTLIYSKKEQKEEIEPKIYNVTGTFLNFSKFGEDKDTLVAELNCPDLVERNKELVKEYGFISDYDEYKPHFTISYNAKDIDINSLPDIDFAINFNEETIEELNTDWKDGEDGEDGDGTLVGNALKKMGTKDKEDTPEKK